MQRANKNHKKRQESELIEQHRELFHGKRACFLAMGRTFNHKRVVESERKFKHHGGTVV